MTGVELPQLSLQRYLELVKRRRWQLVPVSLAGLLVGGLVAFFIPRYFVATTLIQHEAVPGEDLDKGTDDPFASIVASARNTFPQAVPKAMEVLKWPEAQIADPHEKAQRVRAIADRLSIDNASQEGNRARFAQLVISYRDRDGSRAATFLNTLFDVWRDKRIGELRATAEDLRRQAQAETRRWADSRETYLQELRQIEARHRIAPGGDQDTTREQFKLREKERAELRETLRTKAKEVTAATTKLTDDKELLATMPERVPPDPLALEEAAKRSPDLAKWVLAAKLYRTQVEELFQKGTSAHASAKRGLAQAQREIKRMLNPDSPTGETTIPNAEREALQKSILARTQDLRVLEQEVADLREEVAEEDRRIGDAQTGWAEWENKNVALAEATNSRAAASALEQAQAAIVAKLQSRMPIQQEVEATTPPRPTEPNILVVALIGCVLGLGAAIALILLLDFLQGSFKTVDDVERGLTVPVLGGMSHLETEEERRATVRSRRRASLAAFGFVGLVVVVVTIFYVDPTRLPPVVRDLLAMLLGKT